jgi:hypothetical protein
MNLTALRRCGGYGLSAIGLVLLAIASIEGLCPAQWAKGLVICGVITSLLGLCLRWRDRFGLTEGGSPIGPHEEEL